MWLVILHHADNLKEAVIKECGSNAQRIRVVNRTIYTDYNFGPDELEYPKMFAEMLITAVWLYKDFPDVEFFVWYESAPGACHLRVPFLLTTYIKPEVAQGTGIEGSIGGVPVAIGPLYGSSSPTAERIPYTKGYAIPLPDQWLGLGMLPAQLHASQHLRFLQAEQKKPILQAQAVWRGKITGGIKGWPAPHKPSEWPYKDPWAELLLNKRVYIARVAADRQDLFDVGIISQPSDGEVPCRTAASTAGHGNSMTPAQLHTCTHGRLEACCWCPPACTAIMSTAITRSCTMGAQLSGWLCWCLAAAQ